MIKNKFSWLAFFEELFNKICIENNAKILYDLWLRYFPDKYNFYSNDNKIPINKIDPLSFLGKILSLGDERLIDICKTLKEIYNLNSDIPKDFNGIPRIERTNPTFWNDAWKGTQSPEDSHFIEVINNLWLFAISLNKTKENYNRISKDLIKTILSYDKIGIPKLSQIMFVVKPNLFYSCDGKSLSYLNIGITDNKDYNEFLEIQNISKQTGKKPFELSYMAELYSEKRKNFLNYIEKIKNRIPSYSNFIKQQLKNEKFERIIFNTTAKRVYEIETESSLVELISLLNKNKDWEKYNKRHGNGIPNAILNTHYRNYINEFQVINNLNKNIKYWIYSAGERSYKWDEFYKDSIMAIGWDYLGDLTQYTTQEDIADRIKQEENRNNKPMNDSKANWEFAKEIQIGDIVYVKKGLQDALIGRGIVKSDYIYDASRNEYKSIRKVEWTHNGTYEVDFNVLGIEQWNQKTLTEISPSKYKDFCLKIEDVFMNKQSEEKLNKLQINIPLNQILYGPPGTGKTYSVRKYITDIVGQNPGLKTDNEEQKINNVVKDLTWYSAIALSMYRNGKNNKYKVANIQYQKLIKAFAQTRDNKNIRAALWAQMQIHTPEDCQTVNYTNRQAPYIFEKNSNSEWSLTEAGIKFVEENLSEQLELLDSKNTQRKIEDFYQFITFHQSYSYEEFVEGIKPSINNDEDNATISYEHNRGIFKEICQQANSDPDNNYLLIIDEINRGNISKIFGELITLIEPDKRVIPNGERIFENTKTQNEELLVTLPYTKSKFGVPKNLYILGTMNTSDRSIASIDIALRRRFKFIEMMPQKELVADFGINFADIFENLNTKIKVLLDRDHQIGHSYFVKTKYENAGIDEFKEIWFSEILPLLNEYFYCDWEKLKLIIPGFIQKVDIPTALKNDCDEDIYEFKSFDEVDDFVSALKSEKFEG